MAALAFDPGYANIKLFGPQGSLVMQSAVSVATGQRIRRMTGLRVARPPLCVGTSAGHFYVGKGAHDWGRPVENLDFGRLSGSPEMLALFLGAVSRYGMPSEPLDLIVGLPITTLTGENASGSERTLHSTRPSPRQRASVRPQPAMRPARWRQPKPAISRAWMGIAWPDSGRRPTPCKGSKAGGLWCWQRLSPSITRALVERPRRIKRRSRQSCAPSVIWRQPCETGR